MKTFLLFLCHKPQASPQAQYDLLLKGGHVIDPRNNIDALRDVAIKDRKIAPLLQRNIDPALAAKVLDVKGLYVTPGGCWTFMSTFSPRRTSPDAWTGKQQHPAGRFSPFETGVTTMVDGGQLGLPGISRSFRVNVIDRAKTRVFALINIAGQGHDADETWPSRCPPI